MTSKKIMEEIKKNLSGNMVTTNQIAEKFYKLIGVSASGSQINDLAIKLEKENGSSRHSSNCPCSTPKDKIDQLSCKCFEECYCKTSLSSREQDDLKKGFYTVSLLDKVIFAINRDHFWKRLYKDSSDKSINEEARKGVGLSMSSLEGNTIFVATTLGIRNITVQKTSDSTGSLSNDVIKKLKYIGIYANYIKKSTDIKQIWVTSAERDANKQANLVYDSVYKATDKLAINSMYKGSSGQYVETELKKGTDKNTIVTHLESGILNGLLTDTNLKPRYTGFNHVSNKSKTIDIGANSGLDPAKSSFRESLRCFISKGIILDSRSIEEGLKGEKDCHHLVFK